MRTFRIFGIAAALGAGVGCGEGGGDSGDSQGPGGKGDSLSEARGRKQLHDGCLAITEVVDFQQHSDGAINKAVELTNLCGQDLDLEGYALLVFNNQDGGAEGFEIAGVKNRVDLEGKLGSGDSLLLCHANAREIPQCGEAGVVSSHSISFNGDDAIVTGRLVLDSRGSGRTESEDDPEAAKYAIRVDDAYGKPGSRPEASEGWLVRTALEEYGLGPSRRQTVRRDCSAPSGALVFQEVDWYVADEPDDTSDLGKFERCELLAEAAQIRRFRVERADSDRRVVITNLDDEERSLDGCRLEVQRGGALTTPIELRGLIEPGGERRLCGDCSEGAERRVNLDGVDDDRSVTIRCADIERSRF
jgi:hypothetical protein